MIAAAARRLALRLATPLVAAALAAGLAAVPTAGAPGAPALAPSAAEEAPSDVAAIFREANDRFREAASRLRDDPAVAESLLREALARFNAVVDAGVENGRLYYNIGNTHLLLGDVGRAIANYRRAERLIPNDANLQLNLRQARERTRDRIPVEAGREALRTVFFWHYDLTPRARWWIFFIAFETLWIAGVARALRRRRPAMAPAGGALRWVMISAGALAAAFGASLAVDHFNPGDDEGVIVAPEVVGRKGPDAGGYEPSFTDPLHAGAELRILEARGAWRLARLSDGRETWLPASAIEMIDRAE